MFRRDRTTLATRKERANKNNGISPETWGIREKDRRLEAVRMHLHMNDGTHPMQGSADPEMMCRFFENNQSCELSQADLGKIVTEDGKRHCQEDGKPMR
jgi:hypothetical protein